MSLSPILNNIKAITWSYLFFCLFKDLPLSVIPEYILVLHVFPELVSLQI